MNILILTRNTLSKVSKRLIAEGEKLGYTVDVVSYKDIVYGVSNNKPFVRLPHNKELNSYSKVILRSARKADHSLDELKIIIVHKLDELNAKTLNLNSYLKFPVFGKLQQGFVFAEQNIPTIDYTSFGSEGALNSYLNSDIKYPLILKANHGSYGRTVKKINNKSELEEVLKVYKLEDILLQKYIKAKQWYRTIVARNSEGILEYLGYNEQLQREQYATNEFELKIEKLSDEMYEKLQNLSLQCAEAFNLDYCGIDILYNEETKDFNVIEVNRTAVITSFERETNFNVARKLVGW